MFSFFKRRKQSPEHPKTFQIEDFPWRDQYFYRLKPWFWYSDRIIAIADTPVYTTLEGWSHQVYLDARGQTTVSGYLQFLSAQYESASLSPLYSLVLSQLDQLHRNDLIAFSEVPVVLSPGIEHPNQFLGSSSLQ
ncbi:hypothetical protein COR50_22000 [Chitinophaga caeni]|uniref:Uncharacterized protein n=1 Tax=Chitinophaga caeni TaxID=2029983 RepID=A0A291R0E1_9BACT|nr:hypothetical protein [Chitinophaga caeni]ATL49631.1 hypothetical protein COR50_22000 [Chitinophaga caeni]